MSVSTKDLVELKIFKGDRLCGLLRRRSDGGAEFQYDLGYLAESDSKSEDLCFNLKKRAEPYVQLGINLPPYFAGLLPEGLRLKYLLQKVKTSPDDLFSLFASIGTDCIGDVYAQNENPTAIQEPRVAPNFSDINFYDYFLSTMAADDSGDETEFAGAQEKISASMISLPLQLSNQGTFILKLNPKDKPNLVYNEWVCLYLAQLCGIKVNEFQLIQDRDFDLGLLVKRFDRLIVDTKTIRVHQEDLCQVLNTFPAEKYRLPLKDIYDAVKNYTTAPLIESYNLTRLVVFSYLIGNGDLHAKNISLFKSPLTGQVTLTPAYDLICTLIYGDRKMALKMDGKDSNIRRRDVVQFASRFGLTQTTIETLIDDLLNDFYLHHHVIFSIPMSESKMEFLAIEFALRMENLI
jgi:serine/threonine-protein kinase HipA